MSPNVDYSRLHTYDGDEPYIFVSYAHKDAAIVVPTIQTLQERGYRIWFDLGIEAGTEWSNNIAAHLQQCAAFLVFTSKNSVQSENCLDEISFAKAHQKPSLMIFLEDDVVLPVGTEMQTARFQRMFRSRHHSQETFIQKICEATMLDSCREGNVAPPPVTPPTPKTNAKLPLLIGLCSILLIGAIIALVMAFSGKDNFSPAATESPAPDETAAEATASAELVMSDELTDFTFSLEGEVFQLPFALSELTDRGWTIYSSYCDYDTIIAGDSRESFTMTKRGRDIDIYVYNYSGNARRLEECPVGAIEVEAGDYLDFTIAKGLTPESTEEEITEALGIPDDGYTSESYISMSYLVDGTDNNGAHFHISVDDPEYSSLALSNYIKLPADETETVAEYPEYLRSYQAPTELGLDLFSGTFVIEGDLYRLPAPVSVFEENGWAISRGPGYVASGNTDYLYLKRDDVDLYLNISNFSPYQTTASNCAVTGFFIDYVDEVQLELPGGLTLGTPAAQLDTLITEAFDSYSGHGYINYSYYEFDPWDLSINIDVSTDTNTVTSISYSLETWHYNSAE